MSITLERDVPPRLWPRLAAAIIPETKRVARDGAVFGRTALRLVVKRQKAEMYRGDADTEGNVAVVFPYQ
ncbi:MAG: hypothetical protein A2Z31_01315 [candidate division NC10 bacterium RBG_16_65_8]|nr:MAG: hypothetical protein A2Z31_01315 [candidate division NC10 bacterium RBG_16_65_8]